MQETVAEAINLDRERISHFNEWIKAIQQSTGRPVDRRAILLQAYDDYELIRREALRRAGNTQSNGNVVTPTPVTIQRLYDLFPETAEAQKRGGPMMELTRGENAILLSLALNRGHVTTGADMQQVYTDLYGNTVGFELATIKCKVSHLRGKLGDFKMEEIGASGPTQRFQIIEAVRAAVQTTYRLRDHCQVSIHSDRFAPH